MAPPAAVQIKGLRELRSELRRLDRVGGSAVWSRHLGATHRELSAKVVALAQASADGQAAHFADDLKARGTPTGARVGWAPRANTAFMGAKKHTGWYAAVRFQDGPPQHPVWVGTGWAAGGPGGPYAVNAAVRDNLALIVATYGRMLDDVVARAFPD